MALTFPMSKCPYCQHNEFTIKAAQTGVVESTYSADGEIQHTKQVTLHTGKVRQNWYCAKCNAQLFAMKDCH